MTPFEMMLTLPAWLMTPTGILAAVAAVFVTVGLILAFIVPKPTFMAEPTAADFTARTRREGLDLVLAGKWEWDDYVRRFSGQPDDGSLRAERPRAVKVHFPVEHVVHFDTAGPAFPDRSVVAEDNVPSPATRCRHRGRRVASSRVSVDPLDARMTVWQPKGGYTLKPESWAFDNHPCCPDYVYFTEVNGKSLV